MRANALFDRLRPKIGRGSAWALGLGALALAVAAGLAAMPQSTGSDEWSPLDLLPSVDCHWSRPTLGWGDDPGLFRLAWCATHQRP